MKKDFIKELKNNSPNAPKIDETHYCDYHDNFFMNSHTFDSQFKDYFDYGEGKELVGDKPKASAIDSSSVFAVNFWGWIDQNHTIIIDDVEYDRVVFEEEFRCLKEFSNGRPAGNVGNSSMDVVLVSKDKKSVLLIESKFGEHFKATSRELFELTNRSYNYSRCYYENGDKWIDLIKSCQDFAKNHPTYAYHDGIKQEICHILGVTNLISQFTYDWYGMPRIEKNKKVKNYRSWLLEKGVDIRKANEFKFYNVIFMPSEKFKDFTVARNYKELYKIFVEKINKSGLCTNLPMDCKTYSEIWEKAIMNIPDNWKNYLAKRYMCLSDFKQL